MSNFIRHYVVGNDRPPWTISLVRGIISAIITGALAFLATWTQTDDVKLIISATMTPALTVLMVRFGLEGSIDTRKNGRP